MQIKQAFHKVPNSKGDYRRLEHRTGCLELNILILSYSQQVKIRDMA
jgi:hypothetical protein